jgi:two-component system NtrC family sensor kinase
VRIRTNIFIWVFVAIVVPLTTLTLAATYYSEHTYQREVTREVSASLNNIAANIKRQLAANQNLALGISQAPAVQAFVPVLHNISRGKMPANANILRHRANHYFEGFQTILPGRFILRLLDAQGNTVVKVSHNRISPAIYEGLSGLRYVEEEINDPDFITLLSQLPADEVSSLYLIHNHRQTDPTQSFLIQDAVVPLYFDDVFIGALAFTTAGEEFDRLLDHATRLYSGQLMVAELNPDNQEQHGRRLHDEADDLRFSQIYVASRQLQTSYAEEFLEYAADNPEGIFTSPEGQPIYYTVLFAYPSQFTSWLVASRLDASQISAPFTRIRIGIWLFATAALFISVLLTDLGARRIARPICQLASHIKAFADGDRQQHATTRQPTDEVRALADAFNYLSDTLQAAESERDRAQHMVLQSNKLASIGQMAAGIGHEINNPLNNILSYTKLLTRNLQEHSDKVDVASREQLLADLQSLREETLRASEIVKGILNFARQVPPQYSRFAVQPWLENTLKIVRQAAKSHQVKLELENSYDGELEGDRGQLQQALVNLLLNAIQASPADSTVHLAAHSQDGRLIIKVCDEGTGISENTLDNIFDPFFTTKPEGEGSGLGLSISLGIVERHQGHLEISNNPKQGVTASLTLPLQAQLDTQT